MGIHGGHWSIFHGTCRWTSNYGRKPWMTRQREVKNEKSASHAKGQAVAVGVVIGIAILLIVLLKLI